MPDLVSRALIGYIDTKLETFNNTYGFTTTNLILVHDFKSGCLQVTLEESRRFYRTCIRVGDEVIESLEIEKDSKEWDCHARLAHGSNVFKTVDHYIKHATSGIQNWEVLYHVWDVYLKRCISREDLGFYTTHILRGRTDTTEDIRKWVPTMMACFNRNDRPDWVRNSHGQPIHC